MMIGGGLGAQPHLAQVAHEFLPEDELIPFTEAVLRVFDRHGERNKRGKARMKFLLQSVGLEALMELVQQEWKALPQKTYRVDRNTVSEPAPGPEGFAEIEVPDAEKYQRWRDTNAFEQKQAGFFGVFIKLPLGDLHSSVARKLATVVQQHAANDIRITVNQGLLLKYVRPEALPHLFIALDELQLAEPGFDSVADITACPGTDTCNLGISNSTGIAQALEEVIIREYPDLIKNNDLKIKISGCPNSCGQHGLASIGFHGSSMKDPQKRVIPALQVLLGGGVDGNGAGRIANKVLKIPSKRGPQALRVLLDDYDENRLEGEYYADYVARQNELDKHYFYHLLKPLTDLEMVATNEYFDWGHTQEDFKVEAGVGECAGVIIDLIATLLHETEEKLVWASQNLARGSYADAIYHAYNVYVGAAKALLLSEDKKSNTQMDIIRAFDEHFVTTGVLPIEGGFANQVLQINKNEPTPTFARNYLASATDFLAQVHRVRNQQLTPVSQ